MGRDKRLHGDFQELTNRSRIEPIDRTKISLRPNIERWFMVMDSTDYYQGIIYHASTVEFQCTYPTSTSASRGCSPYLFFFAFSFSTVKLNFKRKRITLISSFTLISTGRNLFTKRSTFHRWREKTKPSSFSRPFSC